MSSKIIFPAFGSYVCEGDSVRMEHDGFVLVATMYRDNSGDTPWERSEGHGPVSDWRDKDSKEPGELVLASDHGRCRFYDYAEACRIARRDGWGAAGDEGMTPRAKAAHAAMADFRALKAWCNDEWCYCGVAVHVERAGVRLTGDFEHALWGIEANYPGPGNNDYLAEVAGELAPEAIEAARAKVAELNPTTYAPGPWSIVPVTYPPEHGSGPDADIIDANGGQVALVHSSASSGTARLIGASPDLLGALRNLLSEVMASEAALALTTPLAREHAARAISEATGA